MAEMSFAEVGATDVTDLYPRFYNYTMVSLERADDLASELPEAYAVCAP